MDNSEGNSQSDEPATQERAAPFERVHTAPLQTPTPRLNRFGVDMNMVQSDARYKTVALFAETCRQGAQHAPYSLWPKQGWVHLEHAYLEIADPTEYRFAMECFGSIDHWEVLKACEWFQPHLERYRSKLILKLRSEAIAKLREKALEGDPATLKWLAKLGWNEILPEMPAEGSKRGGKRGPKKRLHQYQPEDDRGVQANLEALADAERLGLTVIKGSKQ